MAGFKRQILADDPSSMHGGAHGMMLGALATQRADVYCLCQRCGHAAMVDAGQLARQLGPDMPVAEVGVRMRCGGCGSKDVATQPGWATNMTADDNTAPFQSAPLQSAPLQSVGAQSVGGWRA